MARHGVSSPWTTTWTVAAKTMELIGSFDSFLDAAPCETHLVDIGVSASGGRGSNNQRRSFPLLPSGSPPCTPPAPVTVPWGIPLRLLGAGPSDPAPPAVASTSDATWHRAFRRPPRGGPPLWRERITTRPPARRAHWFAPRAWSAAERPGPNAALCQHEDPDPPAVTPAARYLMPAPRGHVRSAGPPPIARKAVHADSASRYVPS